MLRGLHILSFYGSTLDYAILHNYNVGFGGELWTRVRFIVRVWIDEYLIVTNKESTCLFAC